MVNDETRAPCRGLDDRGPCRDLGFPYEICTAGRRDRRAVDDDAKSIDIDLDLDLDDRPIHNYDQSDADHQRTHDHDGACDHHDDGAHTHHDDGAVVDEICDG